MALDPSWWALPPTKTERRYWASLDFWKGPTSTSQKICQGKWESTGASSPSTWDRWNILHIKAFGGESKGMSVLWAISLNFTISSSLVLFQIRTRSPHKKCTIRYDKLYIDNTPYVWDEVQAAVVRYVPPESQRPLSRNNYSRWVNLIKVHSQVNWSWTKKWLVEVVGFDPSCYFLGG